MVLVLKNFCIGFNKVDLYLDAEVDWYSFQDEEGTVIEGSLLDSDDTILHMIKEVFMLNITNSICSNINESKREFTVEINSEKVLRQQKIDALRRMNNNIYNTGDESIYEIWLIGGVPDGAVTDEDYAECLDYFDEITDLYNRIMFDN